MTRVLVTLLLALCACGPDASKSLAEAQEQLTTKDWKGASEAVAAGLAAKPDAPTAWRLELVGLEAQARGGQAGAALATMERLATAYPDRVKSALYVETAAELAEAGQAAGGVTLLDAGLKRFPGDAVLVQAVDKVAQGGNADSLEKLKSLGYIQ